MTAPVPCADCGTPAELHVAYRPDGAEVFVCTECLHRAYSPDGHEVTGPVLARRLALRLAVLDEYGRGPPGLAAPADREGLAGLLGITAGNLAARLSRAAKHPPRAWGRNGSPLSLESLEGALRLPAGALAGRGGPAALLRCPRCEGAPLAPPCPACGVDPRWL
jgi:hypothetical protein